MIRATYKIVHFTKLNKFISVAHNYDHAILIATEPADSYTQARASLGLLCEARNVRPHWFDGEYTCDGSDQLMPLTGNESFLQTERMTQ